MTRDSYRSRPGTRVTVRRLVVLQVRRVLGRPDPWVVGGGVFVFLAGRVLAQSPWSNGPDGVLGWYDVLDHTLANVAIVLPALVAASGALAAISDRRGLLQLLALRGVRPWSYMAATWLTGLVTSVVALGAPILGGGVFTRMVAPATTTPHSPVPHFPPGFPQEGIGVALAMALVFTLGGLFYWTLAQAISSVVSQAAVGGAVLVVFHLVASFAATDPRWSPFANLALVSSPAAWVLGFWLGAVALAGAAALAGSQREGYLG